MTKRCAGAFAPWRDFSYKVMGATLPPRAVKAAYDRALRISLLATAYLLSPMMTAISPQ